MKNIILFLTILIPFFGFSQLTTVNPDTVCYQTSGSIYQVPNTPGYTYNWTVSSPGVLISGQGTNGIEVDWSNSNPGTIVNGITVTAVNSDGCESDPVTLDIFIYQVIPTIDVIGPFCEGSPCVTLIGSPAVGVFSGTGVIGNQFCSTTSGVGVHTITYTITLNGCTFSTTTTVTVNPTPVLSPIQHN
jgi:hypothetical protein